MEPQCSTMGSPLPALLIDCVASFAGFDSGQALLAGSVMGVGGGGGEGIQQPGEDTWSPLMLTCSGAWMHSGEVVSEASANDKCLLPARLSSRRSAYG